MSKKYKVVNDELVELTEEELKQIELEQQQYEQEQKEYEANRPPTSEERLEALEAAMLEMAVMLNG